MLRLTFLTLFLLVSSASSTSMLKRTLSRRQTDATVCQAIEGFDCKCSYYRVTCTTDNVLPSTLTISSSEQQKYQSVELVISAASDINVNEYTFEPVKQLYKPDGNNFEFRVKFEKFTGLQLTSPGIFNRVFPDNLPSTARKSVALEIYNPEVQPNDNVNLFQNINVDTLELYALYPFRGTFQQLFNGANINYLRLSGGDIRSDVSQPFSGNIARLELAKQASALSVQNFPVYPAHELIINAYYISEFNDPHPPNYNNLGELRVHSPERIPANAFQSFPNIHTLSLSSDKEIDPQALNGLNNLEKLIVKDAQPSLALINSLPNLKEFEGDIKKLDENTQCQLLEKLANGQLAVQAIPNGHECTCVSAYLDAAAGRTPCDAEHCEHSSCAAIKNNYNTDTRTFNPPPAILRADGSNAFYPRPARPYTAPFQVSSQDQEKLQEGIPQQPSSDGAQAASDDHHHHQGHDQTQDTHDHGRYPQYPSYDQHDNQHAGDNAQNDQHAGDHTQHDQHAGHDAQNDQHAGDHTQHDQHAGHDDYHNPPSVPQSSNDNVNYDDNDSNDDEPKPEPVNPLVPPPAQPESSEQDENQGDGSKQEGNEGEEGSDDQNPTAPVPPTYDPAEEEVNNNGTETSGQIKKKPMSWLPIIIIAAAIVALLLIGLVVLLIRKNRAKQGGYAPASTGEGTSAANRS